MHASQVHIDGLVACNSIPLTVFGSHLIAGRDTWLRQACHTRISISSTACQIGEHVSDISELGAELRVELGGSSTTTDAFDTEAEVVDALGMNRPSVSGASWTTTHQSLAVARSSLESKLTPFPSPWMVLRKFFVLRAGT